MTLVDILNWSVTILWVGLGVWVYCDASKHKLEKKLKWTFLIMVNPFALRKYKRFTQNELRRD